MLQNTDSRENMLFLLRGSLYLIVNSLLLIIVVYGTSYLCRFGYNFCYSIFGPVVAEEAPGQDKIFEVRDGDDMSDVAKKLNEAGIIKNRFAFYIKTQLMDKDKVVLKVGKYILNTSMDYDTIIDCIAK